MQMEIMLATKPIRALRAADSLPEDMCSRAPQSWTNEKNAEMEDNSIINVNMENLQIKKSYRNNTIFKEFCQCILFKIIRKSQ